MICLYGPDTQDFSNNGLCVLEPTICEVEEVGGGRYELTLTHPITDDLKWSLIQNQCLIKAPVPIRETPLIRASAEARPEQEAHVIWEVHTTNSYASLYSKASSGYNSWSSGGTYNKGAKVSYGGNSYRWNYDFPSTGSMVPGTDPGWVKTTVGSKMLKRLKNGDEIYYHEETDATWSHVTTKGGTTGYMRNDSIRYKRSEPYLSESPEYNTAVPPRQIREQVFRIRTVKVGNNGKSVEAKAWHISDDQMGNIIKSYSPTMAQPQAALIAMSDDMTNEHNFTYYTNIFLFITADWALKNGVEALCDPDEGAVPKLNAQLIRDNYDIFLLQNTVRDRGVVIEYGKNLLSFESDTTDDNVVTRIVPYGTDKSGKKLFLPEVYVDSPYIANYAVEHAQPLQVSEAVEKKAEGEDPGVTKAQCYEKMRDAVDLEFKKGCDLPDITINLDFLHLGDTEEYKQYKDFQQVYLYDTVTVKHSKLGITYKTQAKGYKYDAIKQRYKSITFGSINDGADLGAIAGYQLPTGGISGSKIMPGGIGSQHLRELSVLAAHIGLAEIVNAHIADATIDKAKIKDFTAEVAAIAIAKIGEAWIDEAWIDNLTAQVVDIVTANIGTLIAESVTIDWASIANLTTAVADIVLANIQTANIGWAQIDGLVAETALFTQGASGKLYCADLMVTDANIESLEANKIVGGMATLGKLMLMGQDGKLYEINVGELGEVVATERPLDDQNIGDYTLVDRNIATGVLTARTLDVEDIFANSALIRQLIAQHIDTNTLFANTAYTNALYTHLIQSPMGEDLNLESNTTILLAIAAATSSKIQLSALQALIESDDVQIRTKALSILLRDTSGMEIASFDETGVSAKVVSADYVYASNVMEMYLGSLTVPFNGSPQATIDAVAKYLKGDITINVPIGSYKGFFAQGYLGGQIRMVCAVGTQFTSPVQVSRCVRFTLEGASSELADYISITGDSTQNYVVRAISSSFFMQYCRLTGRVRSSATVGTSYGFLGDQAAVFDVRNCIIERTINQAVLAQGASYGFIHNVIGGQTGGNYTTRSNLGYGITTQFGATIYARTGIPTGETAATSQGPGSKLELHTSAVPTDSSGTPPEPTTRTLTYGAAFAGTMIPGDTGGWEWMSSGTIHDCWQTDNTTYGDRMPVWGIDGNPSADIGSGTVVSATLKLQRSSAWGDSGPVPLYLKYHGYATRSAVSDGPAKPTMIDINSYSFERNEVRVITLNSTVRSALKSGTCRGFGGTNTSATLKMLGTVFELEIVVEGGP